MPPGLSWEPHAVPLPPGPGWLLQVITANAISPLHPVQPETLQTGEQLGPQALSLPLRPMSWA